MARYVPLSQAEINSESSIFSSVAAGFASGLLKTVEGVVSLGAELIDLGADSNTAASVEQFFDDINIFEEASEENLPYSYDEFAIENIGWMNTEAFKAAKEAKKIAEI